MMTESTADEVLSICEDWTSSSHLEVEDITRSPIFQRSLNLLVVDYGQSRHEGFSTLLERLRQESNRYRKSSCAVITRPPEIVACFCIYGADGDFYVIFDSHPRPGTHPDSAAFIFNKSAYSTAHYLANLFRADWSLVADEELQWETQLLGNFSGHLFVAHPQLGEDGADYWMGATLQASLETLALRAEQDQLKSEKTQLHAENATLKADIARLRERERERNAVLHRPPRVRTVSRETKQPHSPSDPDGARLHRRDSIFSSFVQSGSSAFAAARSSIATVTSLGRTPASSPKEARSPGTPWPTPPSPVSPAKGKGKGRASSQYGDSTDDLALALQQQELFDSLMRMPSVSDASDWSAPVPPLPPLPPRPLPRAPRTPRAPTPKPAVATFMCGICLDHHSHEDVAQVDGCGHMFCRDCIRAHVATQLAQRLHPIVCPLCSAEKSDADPAVLSDEFVQQVGLSEGEYATFVELQMASFSMLLHCRGCDNSFFVVKDELDEVSIITCPLPGCEQSWCKMCSQMLDDQEAEHSCDGTAELHRLMGQKGWKYCPGCQTPAEKTEGCNHMRCTGPGCTMHFCYRCGNAIVSSVISREINEAVASHYQNCQMFETVIVDGDD
ncbi:RING-type domain-containing protein [Phanerochaete sordida]|uniref:RBR-type E3 ubiquitin transferase n=1 Tax=Phanerochaete sordida TaxID=48140 RepID=A0A9P3FX94_9APHY|nr:RING-type domain-containing protein [Phanerochaete sordida]